MPSNLWLVLACALGIGGALWWTNKPKPHRDDSHCEDCGADVQPREDGVCQECWVERFKQTQKGRA